MAKDVSKFLQDLNFPTTQVVEPTKKSSKPAKQVPQPSKGKQNEKPTKKDDKKTHKKSESKSKPKPEPHKAREPTPDATLTKPAAVLPSKVSLNPQSHFIFPPTAQWHQAVPPLGALGTNTASASKPDIISLTEKAASLHAADLETFKQSSASGPSTSEASFMAKIIQSGTLSDRLSALTLLVQSSPVHNLKALENLKGMSERGKGKSGRDESLKALRCIVDWWVGGGAPNRKLKYTSLSSSAEVY